MSDGSYRCGPVPKGPRLGADSSTRYPFTGRCGFTAGIDQIVAFRSAKETLLSRIGCEFIEMDLRELVVGAKKLV